MKDERKMVLELRSLDHINCPENLDRKPEGRCRLGERFGEVLWCSKLKACWHWEAKEALKTLASALKNYQGRGL